MEDIKRINMVEDTKHFFSNSLLSVMNKNAVNDTDNVANSPKTLTAVASYSDNNTADSMPNYKSKFRMRINDKNEAMFVILPNSIICLVCYKKFLRISLLKSHILWHLHRDTPSNNLCRFCKSNPDISDCPSFKLIRKIMANFLFSVVKNQLPSWRNNSVSSAIGEDANNNRVMITEDMYSVEDATAKISNNSSHLGNNISLISSNTVDSDRSKNLTGSQEDLYREKVVTSHQDKRTKYEDSPTAIDKSCEEPVIDSSEFLLVNGQYKCLSCSKDYTRTTFNSHVMWHFHKEVDLCSKLHYRSFSTGHTICPLVVQIINYLESKEGKPIQVSWGQNYEGKIIFKVKLLKPETGVDNLICQAQNVSSFQSDNTTTPVAECTIDEPLDQNQSDCIVTPNLTCSYETDSSQSAFAISTISINECSSDTPSMYKTDESLPSDNNEQLMCKEQTDITTAGTGENSLHDLPSNKSDSSPNAWGFYKCMVAGCNYSTLFPDSYLKHLKLFHGDMNSYQCSHCDFTADSCFQLLKHLKIHTHPTEFLFPCGSSDCSYYTRVLSLLPKHFISSHINCRIVFCKHCAAEFTDIDQLSEHYHCNLLKSVKCSYCPARDTHRRRILHHLTLSHPGKSRQIIVSNQLVCNDKKRSLEFVKLSTEITVNDMKEIATPEQEQMTDIMENCLNNNTVGGKYNVSVNYPNGLINPKKHTEEQCENIPWSNEQCNDFGDFEQSQEKIGVKMNQCSKGKDSVKIEFNPLKNISSVFEGFDCSRKSKISNKQVFNNTYSISEYISFDIAGRELDACLRICYKLVDQRLKCKLCSQIKKSTHKIHHHILQDHLHWYLWQCFKCKVNTYSLEEMHWHYQHNHQGFLILVKFLSLPQFAKGSDGKLCLQKEQNIISVETNKSMRTELYRQIQQKCANQIVALRNSKDVETQKHQKLFIFLSEAEKIPDNNGSIDHLAKGEFKIEKKDEHKKSYKRSLNNTSPNEIKKKKFSTSLNEEIEIDASNTYLRDEHIKHDNNNKNEDNNSISEIVFTVQRQKEHLLITQHSEPLMTASRKLSLSNLNKETSLVNDKTVKHNPSSLTDKINTSFSNSYKMKNCPTVNTVKTGSVVEINKVKTDSDIQIREVMTGLAVEISKVNTDLNVEINKMKTGSTVSSNKVKTSLPVEINKMKIGSTVYSNKVKTGSDVEITKVKTGSAVEISKKKTGSDIKISKVMTGSDVEIMMVKTGSPVNSNKVKTSSDVEITKVKTGSAIEIMMVKTGLDVEINKMMIGSTDISNKMKTGSDVEICKEKIDSDVEIIMVKTGSAVEINKVKTGSAGKSNKVKTRSGVDINEMKTGSTVKNSKVKTGSDVKISKIKKTDSDVKIIMVKIGSVVEINKMQTGSTVNSNKVKTGSDVEISKMKTGSTVEISKVKTGSDDNSDRNRHTTTEMFSYNKKQVTAKISNKRHLPIEVPSNQKKAQISSANSPDKKKDISSSDTPCKKKKDISSSGTPCKKKDISSSGTPCKKKNVPHFDISNEKDLSTTKISTKNNSMPKFDSSSKYFNSPDTLNKNKALSNANNSNQKVLLNTTTSNMILSNADTPSRKTLSNADTPSKKTLSNAVSSSKKTLSNADTPSPRKKTLSNADTPSRKTLSNAGTPRKKTLSNADTPSKKTLSNAVSSSKKTLSNADTPSPRKKTLSNADTPSKKTLSNAGTPRKKTLSNADTPRKKTLSNADTLRKKTLSNADTPRKKTLSNADTSSKKTLSNADTPRKKTLSNADTSSKKTLSNTNTPRKKTLSNAGTPRKKTLSNVDTASRQTLSNTKTCNKKTLSNADTSSRKTLSNTNTRSKKTLSNADTSSKKTLSNANTSIKKALQNTSISNKKTIPNANISSKKKANTTTILLTNAGVVHRGVTASNQGSVAVRKPSGVANSYKQCKLCDYTFLKTFQLIRHMTVKHAKKYKDFITEREIKMIKDAIVKNTRNEYVCPFCKHCCSIRSDCKLHIYHNHLHLKTMKCDQCMFFTRLPFQLKRHLTFHLE